MIPFPNKKYQIIYADPPWSYKTYSNKNVCPYPVMSNEDIYNLPVSRIADENCVLFLWVTFPKLLEGVETIKQWGFSYKSLAFCWVKRNKKNGDYFWGMGYWTRQNAEVCLLATKGKPKRKSMGVHCIVDEKISGHSQKPDEARKRIVTLMGDLPRIELFARQKTEGWDVWGNETDKFNSEKGLFAEPILITTVKQLKEGGWKH